MNEELRRHLNHQRAVRLLQVCAFVRHKPYGLFPEVCRRCGRFIDE